jgi:hypothetical protein
MKKPRKKTSKPSLRAAGIVAALGASSADFADVRDEDLIDREAPDGAFAGQPAEGSGLAIEDEDLKDSEAEGAPADEIDPENPVSLAKSWISAFTKLKAQQIAGISDEAAMDQESTLRRALQQKLEDLP